MQERITPSLGAVRGCIIHIFSAALGISVLGVSDYESQLGCVTAVFCPQPFARLLRA